MGRCEAGAPDPEGNVFDNPGWWDSRDRMRMCADTTDKGSDTRGGLRLHFAMTLTLRRPVAPGGRARGAILIITRAGKASYGRQGMVDCGSPVDHVRQAGGEGGRGSDDRERFGLLYCSHGMRGGSAQRAVAEVNHGPPWRRRTDWAPLLSPQRAAKLCPSATSFGLPGCRSEARERREFRVSIIKALLPGPSTASRSGCDVCGERPSQRQTAPQMPTPRATSVTHHLHTR